MRRVVRHISRGIAKGVGAAVAENDGRPRRLHGDEHRGHGNVRQVHHHPQSIHLEDDALKEEGPVGGIIGPSFEYRDDGTRDRARCGCSFEGNALKSIGICRLLVGIEEPAD
ncbi:hypothetical protein K0M31_017433 [Melipona bicolor]|uniref:Uncharacterized protein n=1 Tax=Melipona bicolor TaxID=60889 RepID=A0AA40G4X9_9HYME|nr:hypothetical protein K0M31_017433 [Melipona bicolor]